MPKPTIMADQHQEATPSSNSSKAQEKGEDHNSAARTRKTYVTKKMREKTKTTTSPSTPTTMVEALVNTTKEITQSIAESATDLVEAVTSQVVSSVNDIIPDNVDVVKEIITPLEPTIPNETRIPRRNNTDKHTEPEKSKLFVLSITLMVMGLFFFAYDALYTTVATIVMWFYFILHSVFVESPRNIYHYITKDFPSILKPPNNNTKTVEQMGPPIIPTPAVQRGLRGMVRPYVINNSQYEQFDLYRD